ncbi:hypothetical protein [Oligoflexus tunisiensis]|uniref:hypothetical protein n=1 Tax=Oligoflexus tunisiensis TaxID=708132 RepID=UPI001C405AB0|nr:hypothetical protein [Oligoflexus tunisiensis]
MERLPSRTVVHIRCHPNETAEGQYFACLLQKDLPEVNFSLSRGDKPYFEELVGFNFVLGFTSAALMEAWIAGLRVVYMLKSETLMERYKGSKRIFFLENSMKSVARCADTFILGLEQIIESDHLIDSISITHQ